MRVCFFFFFFPPDWGYITVASPPRSQVRAREQATPLTPTNLYLLRASIPPSVPPNLSRVLIARQWLQSNKLRRKIWGKELDRYSRCLNDCCLLLSILRLEMAISKCLHVGTRHLFARYRCCHFLQEYGRERKMNLLKDGSDLSTRPL